MKISETIERDCCELTKDFVPSADFRYLFCQHCGQAWEYLENGFGGRSYQRVAVPVKSQFVAGDLVGLVGWQKTSSGPEFLVVSETDTDRILRAHYTLLDPPPCVMMISLRTGQSHSASPASLRSYGTFESLAARS